MDYYEQSQVMPGHEWSINNPVKGSFEISDTVSEYNIFLVLRHTDAYRYNNIWVQVDLKSPTDSFYSQKLDLSLGSDAAGWEGTGMNDIWEVRKRLTANAQRFRTPGKYEYRLIQIMREDPLRHVMAVGLRVQKQN
jgi:gliding motility-associated lipoprotein GldH